MGEILDVVEVYANRYNERVRSERIQDNLRTARIMREMPLLIAMAVWGSKDYPSLNSFLTEETKEALRDANAATDPNDLSTEAGQRAYAAQWAVFAADHNARLAKRKGTEATEQQNTGE